MNKSQHGRDQSKGFALGIPILLAIVVVIIIAAGYFVYQTAQKAPSTVATPSALASWRTWNTKCAYSFSYPKDWHVNEADDANTQCTVAIFAPDAHSYQAPNESGLIVELSQIKKGYKTWNFPPPTYQRVDYTINTPDEDIKFVTDLASKDNVVTTPVSVRYGQLTGKYVLATDSSNPGIKTYDGWYAFAHGNNIYEAHENWHQTYPQDYAKYYNTVSSILTSIRFK